MTKLLPCSRRAGHVYDPMSTTRDARVKMNWLMNIHEVTFMSLRLPPETPESKMNFLHWCQVNKQVVPKLSLVWSRFVDKYTCVWRNADWPASWHISTKSYQWQWKCGCSFASCPGHHSVHYTASTFPIKLMESPSNQTTIESVYAV